MDGSSKSNEGNQTTPKETGMIGKAKSITHTAASLEYAMSREQGEVLDKYFLTGETPKEIEKEMQVFQDLNARCKNNTLSIVLSPSIEDREKLTNKELRSISASFLVRMGLGQHQSITVKHEDKAHTHLHIYVNRIGMQGEAYKDHYIGFKAQEVADQIAQERNLTRAKERRKELNMERERDNKETTNPVRKRIQKVFNEALKQSKTHEEFFLNIEEKGVNIKPVKNRNGKVQGYRAELDGESFKASEIGNKFTASKLGKTIDKAIIQEQQNTHKSKGLGL